MHRYQGKDLYKVLGVSPSATKNEIKSAYRSLARKYHPDVNPGNKVSEQKFKDIGEAYEILTHDSKRKQYDTINGFNKPSYSSSYQDKKQAKDAYSKNSKKEDKKTEPKKSKSKNSTPDKPFNETFSEFLDGIFKTRDEAPKSKPKTKSPLPKKGSDIDVEVSITADEAKNGTVRKVNVLHTDPCPKCYGKRFVNGARCLHCDGNGEISNFKKLNVKIPPGVKEKSKIRIAGEGNYGLHGGSNGDLYLVVNILRSDVFTFEDLNVYANIPITPWEAALGAEIEVPTIDGFVTMKIPPETSTGQKFKLSSQGLTDTKSNKVGDYIITAMVEMPKGLSKEEKDLYKQLSKLRMYNPREEIINGK